MFKRVMLMTVLLVPVAVGSEPSSKDMLKLRRAMEQGEAALLRQGIKVVGYKNGKAITRRVPSPTLTLRDVLDDTQARLDLSKAIQAYKNG